jgi:acetyl-CoA C-acetyltransferase
MTAVFVLAVRRTPTGRFLGSLSGISAVELGVHATRSALAASGIEPARVGEVYYGNARQAGNGPNPARQVAVGAGLPVTIPATTVNMACASGLKAIALGAQAIALGQSEVIVAGGTENMSRVPYLLEAARLGQRLGELEVVDAMYRDGFFCRLCHQVMGETAETLAEEYGIDREEQDAYALESQQRAASAWATNRFADEVEPLAIETRRGPQPFSTDEHLRPDTTAAKLARLPAVFKRDGTVTAGNSSGIVDGATTVVLATAAVVERMGIEPLARLRAVTAAGVDPARMGIGPVPAVRQLLAQCDLELGDIDLVELNEAFAAQVLAVDRELHFDRERLNVLGGAIALGHPIGATGARIVATLVHEMRRRQARRGMATLCVSGGQGMAALFERP